MGFFGKLVEITIKTATLPIDVTRDIFDRADIFTPDSTHVHDKLESINEDIDELGDN